jgi:hypothetical protein
LPYTYVNFGALKAALLQRLQDTYVGYTSSTGSGFVSPTEAGEYIKEALHVLNAQAAIWNQDYVINFDLGSSWFSLDTPGSPRRRTLTDTELYNLIEYHLLEPATGGTWTGTAQYNITGISQALDFRRNELMQISGANTFNVTSIASPTSTNRTQLPDTALDLRRVRWVPNPLSPPAYTIPPYALFREDTPAFDAYGVQDILDVDNPDSYSVTANHPLEFDVNTIPPVPGQWDLLVISSAVNPLSPPASTSMELPNDWCWVPKWGALADLMSNSPEGADRMRAKYAIQRYERGKKAMLALPWLVRASAARVPTDTPSVEEADAYVVDWEENWPGDNPQLVVGALDLVAMAPFADSGGYGAGGYGGGGYGGGGYGGWTALPISFVVTVVANAPIPTLDADNIQLARDGVDAVLAYAQHIAMFKLGGAEFAQTMPLFEQFEKYCEQENRRYAALGITRKLMIHYGSRDQDIDPRFEREQEQPQAEGASAE